MKHIKSSILSVLALSLLLVSCNKEETQTPVPSSESLNYLLMYYGVGGGLLDQCQLVNIYQSLNAGSSDKIKMTFQYKVSNNLQKSDACKNFCGTRRFTLDENYIFKGQLPKEKLPIEFPLFLNDTTPYKELCDKIISTEIAFAVLI